jgi:lipopolysaccharide transport system ATP-binding protein
MSSKPIISVEHLSKAYRIGLKEESPDTLMGALTSWLESPLRNWRRLRRLDTSAVVLKEADLTSDTEHRMSVDHPASNGRCPTSNGGGCHHPLQKAWLNEGHETDHRQLAEDQGRPSIGQSPTPRGAPRSDDLVWALRDVSFEVQEGEVVGIIGRNGAGKSTLLKILSRITEPTSGRAVIRGRVSSLLEVGTGFHPELTGRENIYMNGTVLGMTKREIDRKFDEIVDFSGVERFLDTPIKRYSSGMQVRLAFSVAAHLEPEVLIVDEVLAVGDTDFQQKCTGKMDQVARAGRTVLFVSHNIGSLQALCTSGMMLALGRLKVQGDITDVSSAYLATITRGASPEILARGDREGRGNVRLQRVSVSMGRDYPPNVLSTGCPAEFTFLVSRHLPNVDLNFMIYDSAGTVISILDTWPRASVDHTAAEPNSSFKCYLRDLPLRAGKYGITVRIMQNRELQDCVEGAVWFEVHSGAYRGRALPYAKVPGIVCIDHTWELPCAPGQQPVASP